MPTLNFLINVLYCNKSHSVFMNSASLLLLLPVLYLRQWSCRALHPSRDVNRYDIKMSTQTAKYKSWSCVPDSASSIWMALDFATSKETTHFCFSTSLFARRWKVWASHEITNVQESWTSMKAPSRLMLPRQLCAISAWLLFLWCEWKYSLL